MHKIMNYLPFPLIFSFIGICRAMFKRLCWKACCMSLCCSSIGVRAIRFSRGSPVSSLSFSCSTEIDRSPKELCCALMGPAAIAIRLGNMPAGLSPIKEKTYKKFSTVGRVKLKGVVKEKNKFPLKKLPLP